MSESRTQHPQVVTRFAPSPTGYLHIGGARTALFNWLYARHTGGKFLLRIEDTDRERSTSEAVEAIFKGLDWLQLNHDGEVIYQASRESRHREVVRELQSNGMAYACFMSPDETEAARELARQNQNALRSPWRDLVPSEEQLKSPHVVRFRADMTETLIVTDAVQGQVSFQTKDLDDLILLRSDGTPTYNLAVVVDDHDMGITHIIRGDDHLNNAARQAQIYDAMGWTIPVFAHIPLIHGPDGAKLSKRHGAQAVGDYEGLGYLPEAMRNYLARLGWSHGNQEIISDEELIEWFEIENINRAPSRLDFDKLNHVNAHWLRRADPLRLIDLVWPHLLARDSSLTDQATHRHIALRTMVLVLSRAQTLIELADNMLFALAGWPVEIDEKTRLALSGETGERIQRLVLALEGIKDDCDHSVEFYEKFLKSFVESEGVGFGKIGPSLRSILSKGCLAPDIATMITSLGLKETIQRLQSGLRN